MKKRPWKTDDNGLRYQGATLSRVDNYLADDGIEYTSDLSRILNGPHLKRFVNEASKLEDGVYNEANARGVCLAIDAVAILAVVLAMGTGLSGDYDQNESLDTRCVGSVCDVGLDKDVPSDLVSEVSLRKFPYPFRAGLTIASDCDGSNREDFVELHKFLNTKENTSMGPGVGLEIADSFWIYTTEPGQMSYFEPNSTNLSQDAELITKYAHAGYIDSLHSYGDFSPRGGFTREMALYALEEMKNKGINPTVYIDHGSANNHQNIGHSWMSYKKGDVPGEPEYHTDKTLHPNGPIRFLWKSDNVELVGYDPLDEVVLSDGRMVNAFKRYVVRKSGKLEWNLEDLNDQLSDENLGRLISSEKYLIIANHLCALRPQSEYSYPPLFDAENVAALRNLEKNYEGGAIYVTTTSKLLMYSLVHDNLIWKYGIKPDGVDIYIEGVNDPAFGEFMPTKEQLQGLTFYTPFPGQTQVYLNGTEIKDLTTNLPDSKGRPSVSVPRTYLPPLPED